jgi:hypothetical protein
MGMTQDGVAAVYSVSFPLPMSAAQDPGAQGKSYRGEFFVDRFKPGRCRWELVEGRYAVEDNAGEEFRLFRYDPIADRRTSDSVDFLCTRVPAGYVSPDPRSKLREVACQSAQPEQHSACIPDNGLREASRALHLDLPPGESRLLSLRSACNCLRTFWVSNPDGSEVGHCLGAQIGAQKGAHLLSGSSVGSHTTAEFLTPLGTSWQTAQEGDDTPDAIRANSIKVLMVTPVMVAPGIKVSASSIVRT